MKQRTTGIALQSKICTDQDGNSNSKEIASNNPTCSRVGQTRSKKEGPKFPEIWEQLQLQQDLSDKFPLDLEVSFQEP